MTELPDTELARIKQAVQPWLWNACVSTLHAEIETTVFVFEGGRLSRPARDRVCPMQDVLVEMKTYPAHPARLASLFPSAGVGRLPAVLAASVRLPGGACFGVGVCCAPGGWYGWGAGYLERLFGAILGAVDEHGLWEAGWATVHWEVYDKYTKTFGEGIKYYRDRKIWANKGTEWLDGWLVWWAVGASARVKCTSGEKFNGALLVGNAET